MHWVKKFFLSVVGNLPGKPANFQQKREDRKFSLNGRRTRARMSKQISRGFTAYLGRDRVFENSARKASSDKA